MGLFDEPESDSQAAEDEIAFDEDSKIRLFETQVRESEGGHNYLKKFLPVIAIAIIAVGAFIYMMQPGIGSVVKPPKPVEDAVYDYMLKTEHRSVREIAFYNCGSWYWVQILAEPRSALASVDDPTNQYRLRVDRNGDAATDIQTLPVPARDSDIPCK
jgi:hypothetical protein